MKKQQYQNLQSKADPKLNSISVREFDRGGSKITIETYAPGIVVVRDNNHEMLLDKSAVQSFIKKGELTEITNN